ncbi:DEAD/DEAH box helicase family protein [Methylophilaceae bacterium]|nr:DEAD/DEAH box helicase family protein [Methylophilaceae bacterium]
MANFNQFISTFHTEDNKGGQFEKFCKWFLENDPVWKNKVDKVWLFKDFPDRWSNKDLGVDLVFRDVDKKIWAVQAKCYSQDYYMTYDDMARFLAESNRSIIDKRLLLASTDNLGHNAISVLDGQDRKPVIRYLLKDFQNSKLDYPTTFKALKKGKLLPKPKPIGKYKYQLDPINAVVKSFKQHDRGQLIMACGTGKTFTTLWIKEKLKAENTLILLPSLSLLSQTLTEWNFGMNQNFRSLAICSDFTVSKGAKDDDRTSDKISELPFPVTTDIKEIQLFLKSKGRKVIFSTYQSSKVIADAMRSRSVPFFDLVIADEAHRCAGNVEGSFSTILDDKKIRTKRKLFTTATPKTYSANLRQKAIDRELVITGMDDEKVFGPVFYQLSFAEAIKKKLLTDYQLVILAVNDKTVSNFIDRRELLSSKLDSYTDAKSLATFIGLLKSIRKYDLKRIISFHNLVSTAQKFSEEILDVLELLPKKDLPKGKLATDYVKGTMPTSLRRQKLEQLKALSHGDVMLLTNARCLSEGVDVPALDAVAIIDPRQSKVDIVQTVGRAIRLSNNKKIGTIIIPVFLEKGKQAETVISKSNFKPVWDIVNALKSHDEELSIELDSFRTELGKQKKTSRHVTGLSKIVLDLPAEYDAKFSRAISTQLVETVTNSWNFWYGLIVRYINTNKVTAFDIEQKHCDEEGYKVGQWVSSQRSIKDSLSKERIAKLENLPGWTWDKNEAQWQLFVDELLQFTNKHGYARPDMNYIAPSGYPLGKRVRTLRQPKDEDKKIFFENLPGWTWKLKEFYWRSNYEYVLNFSIKEGHLKIPKQIRIGPEKLNPLQWMELCRKNKRDGEKFFTKKKIKLCEKIPGWFWETSVTKYQTEGFKELKTFVKENGHPFVKKEYKTSNAFALGEYLLNVRNRKRKGNIEQNEIDQFESLPFWDWNAKSGKWFINFKSAYRYGKKFKHSSPRVDEIFENVPIGSWIRSQKRLKKSLSDEKIEALESLPKWSWENKFDLLWKKSYEIVLKDNKTDRNLNRQWIRRQKEKYNAGKLSDEQIKLCKKIPRWDM